MKFNTSHVRHSQITVITLVVLTAIFLLYYFVFVQENKEYIHERAFRILNQNAINLQEKNKNTITNARQEISYRNSIDVKEKDYTKLFIEANNKSYNVPISGQFNRRLEFTRISRYDNNAKANCELKEISAEYWVTYSDTVHVIQLDDTSIRLKNTLQMKFRIKLNDFIKDCLIGEGEVFDGYQIFTDSSLVYGTIPGELTAFTKDKIYGRDSIVRSRTNVHDVEIAGVPYKLFAQKINIGTTKNLVLGGLITKKSYRTQIYQVSMFTILFSLLLMLVLVLGYPFLKLLIMSRNERLKTGDAFFCAFSMIVGSFMVILIALSSYIYLIPEQQGYNKNLEKLSNDIREKFIKELTSIYQQLEVYKSIPDSQLVNASNILQDRASHQYPEIYPYFDNVFWIDADGNPRATWRTKKYNQPYVKVASRQYFKQVMDGRTWDLDSTTEIKPFMLEPVFNRISGENMAVLSVPLDPKSERERYTFKDTLRPVLAVAVSLHSVINPVMPLGYGFCILDKQGRTWFHSDRQKNLQEQFLKESGENRELVAALNGSTPRHINLTYNGQKYLAYSIPLQQMPLSLIVFHKVDYFKSIRTMAIGVSIIYYLLALLPLCLLMIVHKATFNHDSRIHGENFAFRWLAPRNKKRKQYQLLIFVLAGLIIVDIAMLFLHRNEKDLWLMYVFTIITSFVAARSLLYNNTTYSSPIKTLAFWIVYSVLIISLFVGTVEQWIVKESLQWLKPVIVLGMLIGASALFLVLQSKTSHWRSQSAAIQQEADLKVIYPVSIFVWVVLLGVLPALAFYKINYNREQRIAASHHLIQLARDLTNRTIRIEDYYRYTRQAKNNDIISSLAEKHGVYHHADARIGFNPNTATATHNTKDNRFADLIPRYKLRPLYNPIVTQNYLLLKPADKPGYWRWTSDLSNDSLELHFFEYNFSLSKPYYPVLKTGLPSFGPTYLIANRLQDTLLLLLGLATILFILYGLIRYAAIYLFNFIILEELSYNSCANKILSTVNIKDWAVQEQKHIFLSGSILPNTRDFKKLMEDAKVQFINLKIISGNIDTIVQEIDKDNKDDYTKNIVEIKPGTGTNGSNESSVKSSHTEDPVYQAEKAANLKNVPSIENQILTSSNGNSNESHIETEFEMQANLNQYKTVAESGPATKAADHPGKFIITHFEQFANWAIDENKYQAVTNLLYQLIDKADSVLIFSLKDLHEIKDSIQKSVSMHTKKEEGNDHTPEKKTQKAIIYDNWGNLLGSFQERHFHLHTFSKIQEVTSTHNNTPKVEERTWEIVKKDFYCFIDFLKAFVKKIPASFKKSESNPQKFLNEEYKDHRLVLEINKECEERGPVLENIRNQMLKNLKELKLTRGGIILKIQQLARLHYAALWQSCTREEQYVLYDLAQDGLVNSKNIQAITSLLEKGLLIYDGTIRIMNRSFRNYILASIQPHQGLIIEREITAKGPWSEFKTALVLVISAIIAFIFATQRETYDQIIAVITTFTASIPLLLKLLGNINFNRSKPAE